jgi:hypothetical protein
VVWGVHMHLNLRSVALRWSSMTLAVSPYLVWCMRITQVDVLGDTKGTSDIGGRSIASI